MARAFGSGAGNGSESNARNVEQSKLPPGFAPVGPPIVAAESGDGAEGNLNSGSEPSGDGIVDPETIGASGGSGSAGTSTGTGKRRGRKPGSKNRSSSSTSKTTDSLSTLLFSLHLMGAAFTRTPQVALTKEESEKLSEAVLRVSELYDIPILDEKTLAWINLATVAGGIYGTRAVSIVATKKAKKAGPVPPRFNTGFEDSIPGGIQ